MDDLADNLFLLQTVLETEGYEVDTADNGSGALVKISASPPDARAAGCDDARDEWL